MQRHWGSCGNRTVCALMQTDLKGKVILYAQDPQCHGLSVIEIEMTGFFPSPDTHCVRTRGAVLPAVGFRVKARYRSDRFGYPLLLIFNSFIINGRISSHEYEHKSLYFTVIPSGSECRMIRIIWMICEVWLHDNLFDTRQNREKNFFNFFIEKLKKYYILWYIGSQKPMITTK